MKERQGDFINNMDNVYNMDREKEEAKVSISRDNERGETLFRFGNDLYRVPDEAKATDHHMYEINEEKHVEEKGWKVGGGGMADKDEEFAFAEREEGGNEIYGGTYVSDNENHRREEYKRQNFPKELIDAIELSIKKAKQNG